jgi:hypothetical protein
MLTIELIPQMCESRSRVGGPGGARKAISTIRPALIASITVVDHGGDRVRIAS